MPLIVQRTPPIDSESVGIAAFRRGAIISTLRASLLFAGAVLLGIAARAVYGTLPDPELALPTAAADFLPGVLAGVIAGMCTGFTSAIVWLETLHEWLYELLPAFILAFIAVVVTSRLFPTPSRRMD